MIDAITLEVIRHGLLAAAEEMARNLCRTSYNTIVYEIHDYGIGIHDINGDVVADTPGIAVFTRANDFGIKTIIDFLGTENMEPGDIFINNYPYWSGAHTLDTLIFAPVHHETVLIGFVSCRIHILDLKQKDAGYVLDSTDMYQEGIFFPGTKVYKKGIINHDFFNIIKFNSRMPTQVIGDLQAQVSACQTGVLRVKEIIKKYGADVIKEAMIAINEHGEKLARIALSKLPRGTWTAFDFVDNDGVDLDRPIKINVTITITEDEMLIDFTGSEKNVRGPINLPIGMTMAFCSLIFKSLTTPNSSVVAGNFAPLRIIAEKGSVMNAVAPMPTFTLWTGLLGGEVVLKALAQGMPDLVPACSGGDVCSMMGVGINPRNNEMWIEATNEAVGFGGHKEADGEDGIMHLTEPGCRNNPVEVIESKTPMFIESYGYRIDSGGPGMHRGGVGVTRVYRFLAPSSAICIVYKTKSCPWAIGEGKPGTNNHVIINPGLNQTIKGGSYNTMKEHDVLSNNSGGGGGYGNPFTREIAKVVRDVKNGFVSLSAAKTDYGVILNPINLEADDIETAKLRQNILNR
jgi:N-methylhydantoinase B